MTSWHLIRTLWFAFLVGSFPAATVSAQPSNDQGGDRETVARQIRQVIEELQVVREESNRDSSAHRDRLGALRRQIETLRDQVERAEKSLAEERTEIADLETRISQHVATADQANSWIRGVVDAAKPVAMRVRQRIERGAGDQRLRRLTAVDDALSMLNEADDSVRQVAGLRTLFSLFGDEWTAARTVVLTNEALMLPDSSAAGEERVVHAWVVTFGLAAKAFVSEDGKDVGIWSVTPGAHWQLALPAETQQHIRSLMEIVRESQPPALTPLPISLPGIAADVAGKPTASAAPAKASAADDSLPRNFDEHE